MCVSRIEAICVLFLSSISAMWRMASVVLRGSAFTETAQGVRFPDSELITV